MADLSCLSFTITENGYVKFYILNKELYNTIRAKFKEPVVLIKERITVTVISSFNPQLQFVSKDSLIIFIPGNNKEDDSISLSIPKTRNGRGQEEYINIISTVLQQLGAVNLNRKTYFSLPLSDERTVF